MVDKEMKSFAKLVAKEIVKQSGNESSISFKQSDRNKVRDYKGMNFTTSQMKALDYWLQPEHKERKGTRTLTIGGWNLVPNSNTKVEKSWVTAEGETKSKEFEAVEIEKDGTKVQKVFVSGVLKSW